MTQATPSYDGDDETYRLAEIKAAENGTSVSELVKDHFSDFTGVEAQSWKESFRDILMTIRAEHPGFKAADNLPREELYDRNAFR